VAGAVTCLDGPEGAVWRVERRGPHYSHGFRGGWGGPGPAEPDSEQADRVETAGRVPDLPSLAEVLAARSLLSEEERRGSERRVDR